MSISQLVPYVNQKVKKIKEKKDISHKAKVSPAKYLPAWLMQLFIQLMAFLSYNLNITFKPLQLLPNVFGNVMLTNLVGMKINNA
jgi:hypothetical protein